VRGGRRRLAEEARRADDREAEREEAESA
jgi:hypothetical protein